MDVRQEGSEGGRETSGKEERNNKRETRGEGTKKEGQEERKNKRDKDTACVEACRSITRGKRDKRRGIRGERQGGEKKKNRDKGR